ncbi:MAG: cupin domain-containing protein [Planctomycetota bacterium]|jgi:quercetin dioxygenase-like cupin family protein
MASNADQPLSPSVLTKAADLSGLIDVQHKAVVSKTLLDNPGGTVTLFAFDGGQGLSEHSAPYDAMAIVLTGTMQITIAGQAQDVLAGQALIMPADQPHALQSLGWSKMLLVMIRS